ncbi:hypothetical protein N7456_007327 [Penicillium angulare]|uniref:Altered inheritance of mitochondria protein 9, mitochondrial n=1 Tax=Penicillium angulare TaxID=116970 RepID=A0A9W9FAF5_9EURO|nr:hypothetical protein N7456_007327 [Penicillium angulare]
MNSLAGVAADAIGAATCISIKKYSDGMFNKAFLMAMDDGREVVAKVPNPNAGIPHHTTASEVATMDFARRILDTPVPRVHAWNSDANAHPVGAEFIIMDKANGVPLSRVWETMKLSQKAQVLVAMIRLHTKWLNVSFSHYGSLYYAKDLSLPPAGSHYMKDGKIIKESGFVIGPTTARDWVDAERSSLDIDRGPCFLAWDAGLEPETLSLVPKPKLTGLSQEERLKALNEYKHHNVFIGWRKLMQARLPDLYQTVEFRKTPAEGLMFLAHRMFEYGDAHFQSLVVDLRDSWADLPAFHAGGASNVPKFPFDLSEADIQRIKRDGDAAEAGTDLVAEVKEKIGDLWPDKGFIERELYDECKAALDEARDCILEQLSETPEERAEYMDHWPFD